MTQPPGTHDVLDTALSSGLRHPHPHSPVVRNDGLTIAHTTDHASQSPPSSSSCSSSPLATVATYTIVIDGRLKGFHLEPAADIDIDGTVVRALTGPVAKQVASVVGLGDMVVQVNDWVVLGLPCAYVRDVLQRATGTKTIQLAPRAVRADVARAIVERDRRTELAIDVILDRLDVDDLNEPFAVLQCGYLSVQDRTWTTKTAAALPWTRSYVVLRRTTLECCTQVGAATLQSDLPLTGRRCVVQTRVASQDEDITALYVLELHVDDEVFAFRSRSKAEKTSWANALTLAIAASAFIDRPSVTTLANEQVVTLRRLLEREKLSHEALPVDEIQLRVKQIRLRVDAIGSADVTHLDPAIQRSLRDEYARLKYDHRVYGTLAEAHEAEQARRDRDWEDANLEQNRAALEAVRRCLPVDVRDCHLLTGETPSGVAMSPAMLRQFKHTTVLRMLRRDPERIRRTRTESLDNPEVDGLTLTERRALHMHLRELRAVWEAEATTTLDDGDDESNAGKLQWLDRLKTTFQRVLKAYDRHVAQYGPPGHHPYATGVDDTSCGCPLQGKQCPLMAERELPYHDLDLGFPSGDVFVAKPRSPYTVVMHREAYRLRGYDAINGFLVRDATSSYGSSSIWTDPTLLSLRLDANDLTASVLSPQRLTSADHDKPATTTAVVVGSYRGEPVAIKRLTSTAASLANAAELAITAKSLAQLTHANLVPIVGLSWTKAFDLQVVMPLAAGGDLRSLLDTDDAASLT